MNEVATSNYKAARRHLDARRRYLRNALDALMITCGVLSAGFGLRSFLLPNSFIDGGVTGISLLVSELSGISVSVLIVLLNIPFLWMGYKQMGKNFFLRGMSAIVGLALVVHFLNYPVVTFDKVLAAAFGGFFLGAGIGLAIRGGGVLDGTEILAIHLNKRTGLTIGDIILVFNIALFSVAATVLSVEIALYSILTYMAASKTVDFIVDGIEEFTSVTIISSHTEEIRLMLTEKMRSGVTIYSGKRGYGMASYQLSPTDIIYTVITRLEIARLKAEIERIDPNAFLVFTSIREIKGGVVRKRLKSANSEHDK
jgi:uncharacterized membrane-anchored protein YitT (DUF2179 family)